MTSKTFDAIIIGAGQAGPPLAGRLTAAGYRVALVERSRFGGTCVNTGCMPTKAMIASAQIANHIRRAEEYGIRANQLLSVDLAAVTQRKDSIVERARGNVKTFLDTMPNCRVLNAHAQFVSPHEVRVDNEILSAPKIFINVGGRASVPKLPGIDAVPYLTNSSLMALSTLPDHLVIIGGSYIGLEFAQMFRRFGSEVTVVEKGPRLLAGEDDEVSIGIRSILEREGIRIRLNAECIHFERRHQGVAVGVKCAAHATEVKGSHVLLAVGRRPNTDDLGASAAGLALDGGGYIMVDDQLRTNVEGVWALGDCNGKGAFTHTSYNDFEIVAANLLDGQSRRISQRTPCYALFIDPPLGRVGLTEKAARAAGFNLRTARRPMTRVGRAIEQGETAGFMKVVIDADTEKILGASILGITGDESIHGILDSMTVGATYHDLRKTMHIHPTVSELIPTMLSELPA